MTNIQENRFKIITFFMLVIISFFTLADILLDIEEGIPLNHLIHEGAIWLFCMIAAIFQFRVIKWQNNELAEFKIKVDDLQLTNIKLQEEQKNFQKKISHLSTEFLINIDDQFDKWEFTRAEKEIALLLIKGLAMKEIAEIRQSSENTVRQQASQIYKKSSMGGRMELSAFFLDDLLALSKLPEK
jgi:DNA-binding CsgD family transcriptional regulator